MHISIQSTLKFHGYIDYVVTPTARHKMILIDNLFYHFVAQPQCHAGHPQLVPS